MQIAIQSPTLQVDLDAIRASAQPVENIRYCGVYFLFDGDDLVYIGKSVDVHGRVRTHCQEGCKRFDRWAFVPVAEAELVGAEKALILEHKPKYNIEFIPERKPQRRTRSTGDFQDCRLPWLAKQWNLPLSSVMEFVESRGLEFRNGKARFYDPDITAFKAFATGNKPFYESEEEMLAVLYTAQSKVFGLN
jgi:predicted GIY-YIG superfamily endonuclease